MEFGQSSFNLDTPESWLIIMAYAGFWIYSYYSLIVFLIHTHKENQSATNNQQLTLTPPE